MSGHHTGLLYFCVFFAGLFFVVFPDAAFASSQIANTLCLVTSALTGSTGKAIASLGVAAVGILALYGRASWGTAFLIASGIAMMFGGASIIQDISQAQAYTCTNAAPQFQCNGPTPSGSLFDVDTLAGAQGAEAGCVQTQTGQTGNCGMFARVLWIFKNTVGTVMSKMYCGFADALRVPLTSALTIFFTVYGIMIIAGIANFNLKEGGVVIFKFALVWAFAMNAEWGIGVGYNFFVNFAEEASNIVLAAIPHTGTAPSLSSPDAVIGGVLGNTAGTQNTLGGLSEACTIFLYFLAVSFIVYLPPLIAIIVVILLSYIGNFAKALLNYLTSLVLISFMFILAPFFLGFALFRTTMPLFEAWVKHLIAFSLQMVVMFAFMALLAMIPFTDFLMGLLSVFKSYSHTFDFGGPAPLPIASFPMSLCGVCDYTITTASVDVLGNYHPSAIQCNDHSAALAGMTQQQMLQAAASWHDQTNQTGYTLGDDNRYFVMSVLNLIQHSDFAKFIIIQGIALWMVSKTVGDFMLKSSEIASAIGKVPIASGLGGGAGGPKYLGLESVQAGFIALKNAMKMGFRPSINPILHPVKFAANRLNPANAIDEWKKKIDYALHGEEMRNAAGDPIQATDWRGRKKVDKHGNPINVRKGSIWDAFLHGAADTTSQGRQIKLHQERARKHYNDLYRKRAADAQLFKDSDEILGGKSQTIQDINKEEAQLQNQVAHDQQNLKGLDTRMAQLDGEINDQERVVKRNATLSRLSQYNIEKLKLDELKKERGKLVKEQEAQEDLARRHMAELRAKQDERDDLIADAQRDIVAAHARLQASSKEFRQAAELKSRLNTKALGHQKHGLLGTVDEESGRPTFNYSSLGGFRGIMQGEGDETAKHIDEMQARHIQRSVYGRVLNRPEEGHYGFMSTKYVEGYDPAQIAPTLNKLQGDAQDKLRDMKVRLYTSNLSATQYADLARKINAVEASLGAAVDRKDKEFGSDHDFYDVLKALSSIEREFK